MPTEPEATSRRAILVTGGAAGIGWATAQRFAAQGDCVGILDRDAAAAEARAAELGGDHFAIAVDIADKAASAKAIAAAHARMGRLDVLVNNAATIYVGGGPTLDLDIAAYRKLMSVNVSGAQFAAREAAAIMQAQSEGGAIVNLASLVGLVAVPNRTAYSISKAAMIGLSRTLASEFAPLNIRVNAVLPGFTATETYRASQRERALDGSRTERRIPLGRMADPDEIAAAICHLASTDARFTHGAMLIVDGGFSCYGGIDDISCGGVVRPIRHTGSRVALITGAGSAMGEAIVMRLAARGMQLILLDCVSETLTLMAAKLPDETIVMATDAIDRSSVYAAVEAGAARFGRVDLLINASDSPLSAAFDLMLDDCLTKSLMAAQATVPTMIRQGHGAVVNLCAPSALPNMSADDGRSASQAGMEMLTRNLACEWGRHGIRVNAVVPGHPEGTAAAVDFLGSDDASYITGTTYVVDR